MASLRNYQYVITTANGRRVEIGSLESPTLVAAADDSVFDNSQEIAVSTATTLWTAGTGPSDFDFVVIASDFDLMVELVTDKDADVGTTINSLALQGSQTAATYGTALILADDASYAGATVGFGGTLDVIDQIKVKNLSASQAAQCLFLLFT